ncbi:hypothetical protein BH23PLA1_BH23PLA1_39700 [soil metagenome]
MAATILRIGIAGCGISARIHAARLVSLDQVQIVGLVDPNLASAKALAAELSSKSGGGVESIPVFEDHRELLSELKPDVLGIFTPHRAHYRPAMDGLQAGCHLFIEKPLSTNAQEANDIVKLAKGRGLIVAVGHQYRLQPSLIEARRHLRAGTIGKLRLISAIMVAPWLKTQAGPEGDWRSDPKISGGGILADLGDHLLDALLWMTGQSAVEVAAFQDCTEPGLDIVNAITLRLSGGTPATLAISGVSTDSLFEMRFFGDQGTLCVKENSLDFHASGTEIQSIPLAERIESVDSNFVAALCSESEETVCCPADEALETVRLQEAIARSAASGQIVRLA